MAEEISSSVGYFSEFKDQKLLAPKDLFTICMQDVVLCIITHYKSKWPHEDVRASQSQINNTSDGNLSGDLKLYLPAHSYPLSALFLHVRPHSAMPEDS